MIMMKIEISIMYILASLLIYGYNYLVSNYNDITVYELVYYTKMPLKGANSGPFVKEIPGIIITLILSGGMPQVIFEVCKRINFMTEGDNLKRIMLALPMAAILLIIILLINHFHVIEFLKLQSQYSRLYEERYVNPKSVKIELKPGKNGKKRNLIYIYLESMESCYSGQWEGGTDYIPELTALAKSGIDFSRPDITNGAFDVPGATFTTGAMVAHSSGISINLSIKQDGTFIPGMTGIGDILKKEGYNQEFLLGSDLEFGGREPLMKGHGDYEIFDYKYAKLKGYIPQDYYVWWGFEDEKLLDFAKKETLRLAAKPEPFNLTLLTVDTHFLDGYKCRCCENKFNDQYANALACSSKQVSQFVEWLKQQDFYENTTVVLCGDHPTMDSGFIKRAGLRKRPRQTFVAYINVPDELRNKEEYRAYTTLDLFPTTLAAIGAEIEGNRLGLGTNLFSKEKTLLEKLGKETLSRELTKKSEFYDRELLSYGKKNNG